MRMIFHLALGLGWYCVAVGVALGGEQTSANLDQVKTFINGKIPIKNALVFRDIRAADGRVLNREWFRFGYQNGTWFAQRLSPDAKEPSKLTNHPLGVVVGASDRELWTISDENMHVAELGRSRGSVPEAFGSLERSLVFSTLALGVPRRLDITLLSESEIQWNGTRFSSQVITNIGAHGESLKLGTVQGEFEFGSGGRVIGLRHPSLGKYPSRLVRYEYPPDRTNTIPARFIVEADGRIMTYEFLALDLGENESVSGAGYLPGMFAVNNAARNYTFWTNDRPYSFIEGHFQRAYGSANRRATTTIFLGVGLVAASVSAFAYKRWQKTTTKG